MRSLFPILVTSTVTDPVLDDAIRLLTIPDSVITKMPNGGVTTLVGGAIVTLSPVGGQRNESNQLRRCCVPRYRLWNVPSARLLRSVMYPTYGTQLPLRPVPQAVRPQLALGT
jgi:hypothetical protein